MNAPALAFSHVVKEYASEGGDAIHALRDVSFAIPMGRSVAIVGRSGSGKSTLLNLAAGIDVPTSGTIAVHGRDVGSLTERQRTMLRREEIGIVFQFFHLLPHLSVRDNVALPELIAGGRMPTIAPRVETLLSRVGLSGRQHDNTQQLSGGEMQRVAICRAVLRKPPLILADEPTGNLDDHNGRAVMNLMLALAREERRTLVYVTHSRELASLADETWTLHSGVLDRP